MALNCVKAAVVRGACKRQNIDITYPLSLTLEAELGATKPVRIRHVIPPPWAHRRVSRHLILGAPALPGCVAMGHLVLATPPSPPPLARRRVSTDLILGAPAPSPAHHDILRGISG